MAFCRDPSRGNGIQRLWKGRYELPPNDGTSPVRSSTSQYTTLMWTRGGNVRPEGMINQVEVGYLWQTAGFDQIQRRTFAL
jgi:hypothetical protein